MVLLTEYGPKPITPDLVHHYANMLMAEVDSGKYHVYQKVKRVWAQKPLVAEAEQVESPCVKR